MATEAQKRASIKWTKENTVTVTIRFNKETEAEFIKWLESKENKSRAIKDAIMSSM